MRGVSNQALFTGMWAFLLLSSCRNTTDYEAVDEILQGLAKERMLSDIAVLTRDLHMLPDFCGNRSPLADPQMRGTVSV